MKTRTSVFLAALALATVPFSANAGGSHVTVPMKAMSGSGQSGSAKITRTSGDHITVAINLSGVPAGASEPVLINAGSCSHLNPAPKVTLNPVVGGRSITTQTGPALNPGAYSIKVYKSVGAGMDTIVSCGDIHIQ